MHALPHHYTVSASAEAEGIVELRSDQLRDLSSTPPPEWGGPPGYWSPETLFMASVVDCLVLSFRAIAAASRVAFTRVACTATGTLDRSDQGMRFTRIDARLQLELPAGSNPGRAERLVEKTKRNCLVSNSLNSDVQLLAEIRVAQGAP